MMRDTGEVWSFLNSFWQLWPKLIPNTISWLFPAEIPGRWLPDTFAAIYRCDPGVYEAGNIPGMIRGW